MLPGLKKDAILSFLLVIGYAFFFFIVQWFCVRVGIFHTLPTGENMIAWDGGWYHKIVEYGYQYNPKMASNSGFFVLLPWLWKWLHLSGLGVCLMNTVFFATGFSILTSMYRLTTQDKLLWLSIPPMYFMFVPYTEAIFFLLMTFCMYGISKGNNLIIWFCLILLSLTRATAIFLIPAFLIMEMLSNPRKKFFKSLGRYLVVYVAPLLLGLAIFIYYQYTQTGIWLAYFKQQSTFWGRAFTWPVFPLSSMEGGDRTIWLSALAMFVCLIAIIYTITLAIQWLFKDRVQEQKLTVLSVGYLSVTILIIVFFNPKWGTNTTNVMGMFRYAIANPLFLIFLYRITHEREFKPQHYLYAFLLGNMVWLAFASYLHLQYFLFFNFNMILIFLFMLYGKGKIAWAGFALIALNYFLQMNLFQQFISNLYPD